MVIFELFTTSTLNVSITYNFIRVLYLSISVQVAVTWFEADDTLNYLQFAKIEVFTGVLQKIWVVQILHHTDWQMTRYNVWQDLIILHSFCHTFWCYVILFVLRA